MGSLCERYDDSSSDDSLKEKVKDQEAEDSRQAVMFHSTDATRHDEDQASEEAAWDGDDRFNASI